MGLVASKLPQWRTQSVGANNRDSFFMEDPNLPRLRQDSSSNSDSKLSAEATKNYRWVELMQNLQKLSRLHRQGATTSVLERQKRVEVAFKRTDVWKSDALFMSEIQRLEAEGKLGPFKELLRLGKECQVARDTLGPLEDELAQMDQKWESQKFQLKKAEEEIYTKFGAEFEHADRYSRGPESEPSTNAVSSFYHEADECDDGQFYSESAETGSTGAYLQRPIISRTQSSSFPSQMLSTYPTLDELEPPQQDSMLLGLEHSPQSLSERSKGDGKSTQESHLAEDSAESELLIFGNDQNLILNQYSAMVDANRSSTRNQLQFHKQTKLGTASHQINSWLLEILLLSRIQANILKERVDASNTHETPSNWAQLVLALWEIDGSAVDIEKKAREASLYHSSDDAPSYPKPTRSSEPILSHNSNQATVTSTQQNRTYVSSPDVLPRENLMNPRRSALPILSQHPPPRLHKIHQDTHKEDEPP